MLTFNFNTKQTTDLALLHGGTLKEVTWPSGPITMKHIVELLRFDHTLVQLKVPGSMVLQTFENSVSSLPNGGGKFLNISGADF